MRDPKVEQFLEHHKIDYAYREVLFTEITADLNKTRLGDLTDPVRVYRMFKALVDGLDLPAMVMGNGPDGKLIVYSGNNRLKALLEAEHAKEFCYTLGEVPPRMAGLLPTMLNVLEGATPTDDTVLAHAYNYIVRNPDIDTQWLADMMSLKKSTLDAYVRRMDQRNRANRLGIEDQFEKITPSVQGRFVAIKSDVTFKRVVEFIASNQLSGNWLVRALAIAKEAPSERDAAEQLDTFQKEVDKERTRAKPVKKKKQTRAGDAYHQDLRRVVNKFPIQVRFLGIEQYTDEEITDFRSLYASEMEHMRACDEECITILSHRARKVA